MALVRFTQGYLFNPAAKTLDLSRLYPNIDLFRIRQIRQDNDGKLLYVPGDATRSATFTSGVVTFTGTANDTTKMKPGDPISVVYDEIDNDSPFATATTMTAGTAYTAGRAVWFVATTAGTLTLTLAGGGTMTVPVAVGLNTFPVAATQFALGGSAAGTAYNMA